MSPEPLWMSGEGSAAEDEVVEVDIWDKADEAYDQLKED
jgi:hypothetical protein